MLHDLELLLGRPAVSPRCARSVHVNGEMRLLGRRGRFYAEGVPPANPRLYPRLALRHLDLSMVMQWRALEPVLELLAAGAPGLESLAAHGLEADAGDLSLLVAGCPRLRRLQLRGCQFHGGVIFLSWLNHDCTSESHPCH